MKKLVLILLSLMLCVSCTKKPVNTPTVDTESENTTETTELTEVQKEFDEYVMQCIIDDVMEDYTTIHQMFENPENFGIDMSKVSIDFGELSVYEEDFIENNKELEEDKEAFAKFNRDDLTPFQQETYDMLARNLEIATLLSDEKFNYIGDAFGTMTGIHSGLATFFTDWELRNEEDVKNVIPLMKDTRRYIDEALEYTKIQNEKGTITTNCEEVIEYCQNIVDTGMDSAVLVILENHVDAVDMDDAKREEYMAEIYDAFENYFLPAYQDIVDVLTEIDNNYNGSEEGLYYIDGGIEYYEIMMRNKLGMDMPVEDIYEFMAETADKYYDILVDTITNHQDLLYVDEISGYSDYTKMMDDLNEFKNQNFPDVGEINYKVESIDPEIATDGIAAYFVIPAVDSTTVRQIKVNTNDGARNAESIDTFTTVAHEGFPGHMYQYAYAYKNVPTIYRQAFAHNLGYTEGYATYAQFEAMKYLDLPEGFAELLTSNEVYSYCLIVLADIGIHYYGATMEEVQDFLNEAGFSLDDEAALGLYNQLKDNPAAFEPYYVGFAMFDHYKDMAKEALGDKFDEMAFNDSILSSGTAPFDIVEAHVNAYIESASESKTSSSNRKIWGK